MRPGPIGRQLPVAQGGRGGVPAPGDAGAPVRRRGRGDGLRRAGPGGDRRAAGGHRPPGPPAADRAGRLRRPRTSSSTPTSSPSARASRSTRGYAVAVHRGDAADQGGAAGRAHQRRRVQRLVLVPGQRPGPRGDPRGVPGPRHRGGHGHGHRQRGRAAGRTTTSSPTSAERVEDLVLDRRPDATERLLEVADTIRDRVSGGTRTATWPGARRPSRSGSSHALVEGISDFVVADTEEARLAADAAHRGHRGAADGGHERGRRPVRRGPDVPAPGGQERPGHEAGGRPPHPVHRGGATARMGRGRPTEAGASGCRAHRDGHRQGRRPRHRQEHRGGRARLQRLRGHRPGRHGALAAHPRDRAGARAPTSSACPGSSRPRWRRCAPWPPRWSATGSRCRCSSVARPRRAPIPRCASSPAYSGPVVHVMDASRAVGVARRAARPDAARCVRRRAPATSTRRCARRTRVATGRSDA